MPPLPAVRPWEKPAARFLGLAAAAAVLATACARGGAGDSPPAAEFLLAAGDSTYWVKSGPAGTSVRGSSMLLARYGGGFHEVYVTDDDRSYPDATFFGERVYQRDLVRGDSTLVFDDTTVARLAARYAARHPGERPLAPEEEGAEEPATVATTELDVLDVHGPYLTIEHRANVDGGEGGHRHTVRHVVVDLRTGAEASLAALFGGDAAAAAVAGGRRAFDALRDSLRLLAGDASPDAVESLRTLAFDPASFGLASEGDAPAVLFALSGRTRAGEVVAVELPPVRVPPPAWWGDVRVGLPRPTADSAGDRWSRDGYEIVARYEPGTNAAALVLRRPADERDWPLARVSAPVHQIFALDRPPIDSVARRALARAFNESTLYDEQAVTASLAPRPRAVPFVRVRERVPARHHARPPAPLPLPRS